MLYVDGTADELSLARLYVSRAAKILEAARNRNGVAADLTARMVEARTLAAELDKLIERYKRTSGGFNRPFGTCPRPCAGGGPPRI